MPEYQQYTVGYLNISSNTEYCISVFAESEDQAIQISKRKLQTFGDGKYYVIKKESNYV